MPADHPSSDPAAAEEEAVRLLGPLAERRIPVYHLDEIAGVARALEAAWANAASPELVTRLRASAHARANSRLLSAAVLEEEGSIVLLVTAPAAVCAAFDELAGRLDSHTEFGR